VTDTAGLTIPRVNWGGHPKGFGCTDIPSTRQGVMVCSGHSQMGSFSSSASPSLGATSIVERASWLCPNLLSRRLVGQASDVPVS
jgi:hypothetical protein